VWLSLRKDLHGSSFHHQTGGIAGVLAAGMAQPCTPRPPCAGAWLQLPKSLDTIFGSAEMFAKTVGPVGRQVRSVGACSRRTDAGLRRGGRAAERHDRNGADRPYYFTGKDSIFAFGCAVPFGLTARQMDAWMAWQRPQADGRVLRQLQHQEPQRGNTGTQMGGWYRKEIKSVADLKGLKLRWAAACSAKPCQAGRGAAEHACGRRVPGAEKGTLDAAEFVGPYDDQKLGFNKVAPFYYYPGWWEGGAELEFFINAKAYAALPAEYKAIVDAATAVAARDMTAKYDAFNPSRSSAGRKTQLKAFPKESWTLASRPRWKSLPSTKPSRPSSRRSTRTCAPSSATNCCGSFSELRFDNYMTGVKLYGVVWGCLADPVLFFDPVAWAVHPAAQMPVFWARHAKSACVKETQWIVVPCQKAGIAGVLAAGIAPAVHAQAAVRWRLASSFPKSLDTIFGSAEVFPRPSRKCRAASLKFRACRWRADARFGVVDGVQNGTVEMAHTAAVLLLRQG
jgi:TRAP-type mannitol/chloroaromatic compound transport system substrate-binding protein